MKKILLAAALAACAASLWAKNPKPDWVDGSSMEFPRENYLTGIGSADDRTTAEDRARGEISKIFSAQVTVNSTSESSESTVQRTGKKDANTFSQTVANNVETISKKLLEGVEIRGTWKDDASRVYYALAVLDKAKAAASITDKITDFDAQIKQWNSQMAPASDKLVKAKTAMKLLALFKARKDVASDLRVLEAQGTPSPVDEAAVRAAASKALSAIDVAVDITGTKSQEVETGVVKALGGFGFQAAAGAPQGKPDILVTGAVETKPVENPDPRWKFARSYVTISLKDGQNGKVFLQFDAAEKSASGDYDTAARRSLESLSKNVSQQTKDGITEYFENQ